MTEEEDHCDQYSEDAVIINVFKSLNTRKTPTLQLNCNSEESSTAGFVDSDVLLPCGHHMPKDYVVALFKYYLKQKKTAFTCPGFKEGRTCGETHSYQDICRQIPLTTKQREFLEENLAALVARRLCDFKTCPGCQSHVERRDKKNMCVQCTICTANKKKTYYFCWNCRREWKGPIHKVVQCGNNGCGERVVLPDPLVHCNPEFKKKKLKEETDDIYPTKNESPDRKRLALLINNVEYEYINDRTGADKDELSMEKLLKALGYTVVTLRDLSAQGMSAAVRDFAKREEHNQSDSCFVVLMSHGNSSGICGVSYIKNSNGEEDVFCTDEIFNCLNTQNCAGLRDKPKIILIQACRVESDDSVNIQDSTPRSNRLTEHYEKDFCCLRSCTPDTVSFRNQNGSDFIQDIAEIFNQHAHQDHIEELFRKVLKKFKEKHTGQMPCKERTTLSRKFYLFPGL